MKILAIDSGTLTGWAAWLDGRIEFGVQDFSLKRGESPGMRFLNFRVWLEKIIGQIKPGLIVFEMAHHRGGHATEVAVGLTTRIQEVAAAHNIEYQAVHSGTLKKAMTGSGRANKEDMKKAAIDFVDANGRWFEYGRAKTITDDNEADAVCLLKYALYEKEYEYEKGIIQ